MSEVLIKKLMYTFCIRFLIVHFNLNRVCFLNFLKHRTVSLRRQPVGGLGLSIKV